MGFSPFKTSACPATYFVVSADTPIMVVYEVKIQVAGYPSEGRAATFHE